MARLIPIAQSGSGEEDYGYSNDAYAAQTMFQDYRAGMDVGGLGTPGLGTVSDLNGLGDETFNPFATEELYKEVAPPSTTTAMPNTSRPRDLAPARARNNASELVGPIIEAVTGLAVFGIGTAITNKQAKNQREHELAVMTEQSKLAAAQSQLAAAQKAAAAPAATSPLVWILGGVAVIGVVGGGIMLYRRSGS